MIVRVCGMCVQRAAQLRYIYTAFELKWSVNGSRFIRTNIDLYDVVGPSHRVPIAHIFSQFQRHFFSSRLGFFALILSLYTELSQLCLKNQRTI